MLLRKKGGIMRGKRAFLIVLVMFASCEEGTTIVGGIPMKEHSITVANESSQSVTYTLISGSAKWTKTVEAKKQDTHPHLSSPSHNITDYESSPLKGSVVLEQSGFAYTFKDREPQL
jgi:hypothetical protein